MITPHIIPNISIRKFLTPAPIPEVLPLPDLFVGPGIDRAKSKSGDEVGEVLCSLADKKVHDVKNPSVSVVKKYP